MLQQVSSGFQRHQINVDIANWLCSGLWRHPRNQTHRYKEISYWLELAKLLDGNFHALFLADMLGIYDVYKGPENIKEVLPGAAQFPISDPS